MASELILANWAASDSEFRLSEPEGLGVEHSASGIEAKLLLLNAGNNSEPRLRGFKPLNHRAESSSSGVLLGVLTRSRIEPLEPMEPLDPPSIRVDADEPLLSSRAK